MCSDYYTSVEVLCALALGSLVAACTLATLHVNGLARWPGGLVVVAWWPGGLVAVGLRWPMIRRLPHGSSVATSPLPRNLILCCSQPGWSRKWSDRARDEALRLFLKKYKRDKKDVRNRKALGG